MELPNNATAGPSVFTKQIVPQAPEDNHYGLRATFRADKAAEKIDLVIGAYRDDKGEAWILPVVKKVTIPMADTKGISDLTTISRPRKSI